jgi:hypothetical protein
MRSVSDALVVCVAEPGPQRVNRFSNRAWQILRGLTSSARDSAASDKPSGNGQPRPACRARRMHSPAAVALTPRLAAILRLDMPAADSLSCIS